MLAGSDGVRTVSRAAVKEAYQAAYRALDPKRHRDTAASKDVSVLRDDLRILVNVVTGQLVPEGGALEGAAVSDLPPELSELIASHGAELAEDVIDLEGEITLHRHQLGRLLKSVGVLLKRWQAEQSPTKSPADSAPSPSLPSYSPPAKGTADWSPDLGKADPPSAMQSANAKRLVSSAANGVSPTASSASTGERSSAQKYAQESSRPLVGQQSSSGSAAISSQPKRSSPTDAKWSCRCVRRRTDGS
eukprot:gnl/TRDRNA2_/TRDRNA2_93959_c0_seq1.p1 gnl/TRDRNA2_/TRDRNA2_93959_c0~~gnl/TRDRNA2_/TRDRNA2_93959_c0_seq1.p1  ORF type:complete len:247 (+),score=41.93 gnl/TRDRNA2_/TRDRNA2_93959_c0_seq1:43-783(+)